jgi:hypothetical protein
MLLGIDGRLSHAGEQPQQINSIGNTAETEDRVDLHVSNFERP